VIHPDGYLQLKDRAKDIIISGGENISSIEIEDVLHAHPAVTLAVSPGSRDGPRGIAHERRTPSISRRKS
jgi:fatty-acyl-CoA synthase